MRKGQHSPNRTHRASAAAAGVPPVAHPEGVSTDAVTGASPPATPLAPPPSASPQADSTAFRRTRLRRIREDVLYALGFTVVLLGINLLVERTDIGSRLKVMTYNAMQHQLAAALGNTSMPVVVVDITNEPGTLGDQLTPRKRLTSLIDALSKMTHRPQAIGLDIDCSPESVGDSGAPAVLTEEEQTFYDYCLQLSSRKSNPMPVYLGVDRTAAGPSSDWLWSKEYSSLAVALRASVDDRFKMFRWIRVAGGDKPLIGISAALTGSFNRSARRRWPSWLRWAVVTETDDDLGPGVKVQSFLVDYSPIDRLQQNAIPEEEVLSGKIADRDLTQQVVLIGNSSNDTSDKLDVADRQRPYPGVLVHACAAYTLLKSPLYEMTTAGRIAADLLLILIIIGSLTALKLWHALKHDTELAHENLTAAQNWLTWAIIIGTFVAGVAFVDKTHLMWDDFPLVAIGLLYHRPIELFLHKLVHRLKTRHDPPDEPHAPGSPPNGHKEAT